jgi:membrane-associated phospholipid phosphatase
VILGMHFLTDVIAGAAIGGVLGYVAAELLL